MDAVVFIGLVIVAITQIIKMFVPAVSGGVTVIVAFAVGILVALVDQYIGVVDITIAEGVVASLSAIGLSALAGKAGGGTAGDSTAR